MHAKNANKAFTEDHTEQKVVVVVVVVVCLFVCLFRGMGWGGRTAFNNPLASVHDNRGETITSPHFHFLVGYMLCTLKSGVGVGGGVRG